MFNSHSVFQNSVSEAVLVNTAIQWLFSIKTWIATRKRVLAHQSISLFLPGYIEKFSSMITVKKTEGTEDSAPEVFFTAAAG